MNWSKKQFYYFLLISCIIGYAWILFNFLNPDKSYSICFLKNLVHIPCPACGSSRAIMFLLNGNIKQSILTNPLGIIIFIALILLTILLIVDFVKNSNIVWKYYIKFEAFIIKKIIWIPLSVLIILNWIWNIYKGL